MNCAQVFSGTLISRVDASGETDRQAQHTMFHLNLSYIYPVWSSVNLQFWRNPEDTPLYSQAMEIRSPQRTLMHLKWRGFFCVLHPCPLCSLPVLTPSDPEWAHQCHENLLTGMQLWNMGFQKALMGNKYFLQIEIKQASFHQFLATGGTNDPTENCFMTILYVVTPWNDSLEEAGIELLTVSSHKFKDPIICLCPPKIHDCPNFRGSIKLYHHYILSFNHT